MGERIKKEYGQATGILSGWRMFNERASLFNFRLSVLLQLKKNNKLSVSPKKSAKKFTTYDLIKPIMACLA